MSSNKESIQYTPNSSIFKILSENYYLQDLRDDNDFIYTKLLIQFDFTEEINNEFVVYRASMIDNKEIRKHLKIGSRLYMRINTLNTDESILDKTFIIITKEYSNTQLFAEDNTVVTFVMLEESQYEYYSSLNQPYNKKFSDTNLKTMLESAFSDMNFEIKVDDELSEYEFENYYLYGNFNDSINNLLETFPVYHYYDKYGVYHVSLISNIINYDGEYKELYLATESANITTVNPEDLENLQDEFFSEYREINLMDNTVDLLTTNKFNKTYYQKSDGIKGEFDYFNESIFKNNFNETSYTLESSVFDSINGQINPQMTNLNENNPNIDNAQLTIEKLYQNTWPIERAFFVTHYEDLLQHIELVFPNDNLHQFREGTIEENIIRIRGFVGGMFHSFRPKGEGGNILGFLSEVHIYSNS